jgi:hypothetical protein
MMKAGRMRVVCQKIALLGFFLLVDVGCGELNIVLGSMAFSPLACM